jgi:uncharacterized RDD family membrane protein YckC
MKTVSLASFGKRLLAFLIDLIIVIIVSLVLFFLIVKPLGIFDLENYQFGENIVKGAFDIVMVLGVLFLIFPLCLLVGFLYDCLMISFSNQATIGKKLMKLKVVKIDGASLTGFEVFTRTIAKFVTGFIFIFLWLICLFTDQNQTLHDKIAGSLVVNEE